MYQDDDDDEEDGVNGNEGHQEAEEEEETPPPKRNKGKNKATLLEMPESGAEDEIEQGLLEVERRHYDDDDGEQEDYPEPDPRRNKKAKFAAEKPGRPRGKMKKRELHRE
jgi:hypothetical protein